MLPSIANRPIPNALPPHNPNNNAGSDAIRHSHSRSLVGANGGQPGPNGRGLVALSLDSKAISQYTSKNIQQHQQGEPRSTRANAMRQSDPLGRSITSAGRHSRQAAIKHQGLFTNT